MEITVYKIITESGDYYTKGPLDAERAAQRGHFVKSILMDEKDYNTIPSTVETMAFFEEINK